MVRVDVGVVVGVVGVVVGVVGAAVGAVQIVGRVGVRSRNRCAAQAG